MLANGHPNAASYPLGYLWNETNFVIDRMTAASKTDAAIMQAVITSVWTGKGEHLKNVLEKLDG